MALDLNHVLILLGRNLRVWARHWHYFAIYLIFQPFILLYGMHFVIGNSPASGGDSLAYLTPGFLIYAAAASSLMGSAYGLYEVLIGGQVGSWLTANVQPASIITAHTALQVLRSLVCVLSILIGAWVLDPAMPAFNLAAVFIVLGLMTIATALWGAVVAAKAPSMNQIYLTDTVIYAVFVFSGVFVTTTVFPAPIQWLVEALPFWHAVELTRPLFLGQPLVWPHAALSLAVLLAYLVTGWLAANLAFRRRLMD